MGGGGGGQNGMGTKFSVKNFTIGCANSQNYTAGCANLQKIILLGTLVF